MRSRTNLVIPVKGFRKGKSRLSPLLDEEGRAELMRRLTIRTIERARTAVDPSAIYLVSPDDEALGVAETAGVHAVRQRSSGLNQALRDVCRKLAAIRTLILPADLPFLTSEDILIHCQAEGIGISPDGKGIGTNALSLPSPGTIPFRFGRNSFVTHMNLAIEACIGIDVIDRPNILFDLDTPEDLKIMRSFSCELVPARK